ncbi:MAG TPA: mechanosensitive ion channel family protein [Terriglobales bacterium]|nr:mechanosensitive ion channel family protein [Terriglobales bacterium]
MVANLASLFGAFVFNACLWFAPRATPETERPDFDSLTWVREAAKEVAFVLVVSFILLWLLRFGTNRLVKISRSQEIPSAVRAQQLRTLAGIINSLGIFVIVFIALMQIMPIFGVNMGPLLASAGVAGIAIGFGAQTLVHDVINGFFILLDNQYNVGDVVAVAGVKGTVEAMTLRRTVLRDADGSLHTIPNSEIKIVSNMTRDWAQVTLHVAVAYSENSDKVIQLLQEIGAGLKNDPTFADVIVAQPEVPGIERVVSGGEVDYLMIVKTLPGPPHYRVSRELRRRIKESFEKQGIKPAGPSQVYVVDRSNGPAS